MVKELEANVVLSDKLVACPIGNKSWMVSLDTCKKCPYFKEIMPRNKEKIIPAKIHCIVPTKFYNLIVEKKEIDFSTAREKED